jgi:ABC-type transport system involved in cytochrome bd biosynthesis fused ATPase/permease subunit
LRTYFDQSLRTAIFIDIAVTTILIFSTSILLAVLINNKHRKNYINEEIQT